MPTARNPDYAPSRPPQFKQGGETDVLAQWIFRELRNVSQSNLDKSAVELRQINAPPPQPREGMIVHADGTAWNPGSGAGPYAYLSGMWAPLVGGGLPTPRDLRVYIQPTTGKIVHLEDYGIVADYLIGGSVNAAYTDNTAAWNTIMANATRGDKFIVPAGDTAGKHWIAFNSPPNQLPAECQLIGQGRSTNALVRAYNPGTGSFTPFLTFDVHTTIRDLEIISGLGTHGGFGISRVATNANDAAQDTVMENISVGGLGALSDSDFTAGIVIDSTLGAAGFGSRSIYLGNMFISRYTGWGLKVAGMNGCTFTNIDFAANTPSFAGLDLYVTGSASNHNNSCIFSGPSLDAVFVEFSSSCVFTTGGAGLITTASTSSGLLFICGSISVAPSLSSSSTTVVRGGHVGAIATDPAYEVGP